MVSVTPFGIVRLPVIAYGPAPAVQVGAPANVPETVVAGAPVSYQTSTVKVAKATLLESNDCTVTRLTPGLRATVLVQRACHADHAASLPLTNTFRVSTAWVKPKSVAFGLVA